MKKPNVLHQHKPRNEGYTQVELAAEIRRRSYELFEQRGRTDGHAVEDWVQAAAEILRPKQAATAA